MSHAIIGNNNEVFGDFLVDFNYELKTKGKGSYFKISPDKKSFKINNSYYKKLFDQNKIFLSWNIYDSKTFFTESKENFDSLEFDTTKIGGVFQINYNLCSKTKFIYDPPKGSVNDFFLGKIEISKGCILSLKQSIRIKPNIVNFGGSSSIIKFKLEENINENFRIDYSGNAEGKILVIIQKKDFVTKLKKCLNLKNTNDLTVNSFFGSILIEAIRRLPDENDYKWKEDLKAMIEFDEKVADTYKEFENAFEQYNLYFGNEKNFLNSSMKQLTNILEFDE